MRVLLAIIFCFAVGEVRAKDVEIRPADAAKHGITIKLSTLNPDIIQAVMQFATKAKEVGLVLHDSKETFVASAVLLPRGQIYVALLSEEYLQHSYFAYPYTADPDEQRSYQVFSEANREVASTPEEGRHGKLRAFAEELQATGSVWLGRLAERSMRFLPETKCSITNSGARADMRMTNRPNPPVERMSVRVTPAALPPSPAQPSRRSLLSLTF